MAVITQEILGMDDGKKAHHCSQGYPYAILSNTDISGLKPMPELVRNLPRFGIYEWN
jgi:hypothetical protein